MRKGLLALALILGGLYFGSVLWSDHKAGFYANALPEEIGVGRLVDANSNGNLLSREACGGALFELSTATRTAIEMEGLEFFATARQGRGYKEGRKRHYYSYVPWKETPLPSDWIGDGKWAAGLHCLGLRKALSRDVIKAAHAPGSYYTTMREGELLVIPSLNLVVFTYFG